MFRAEGESSGLLLYFPWQDKLSSSLNQPIEIFFKLLDHTPLNEGFIAVCTGDTREKYLYNFLQILTNHAHDTKQKSAIHLLSPNRFSMDPLKIEDLLLRGIQGLRRHETIVDIYHHSAFGSIPKPPNKDMAKILYYKRIDYIPEESALQAHYERMIGAYNCPIFNEDFTPDAILAHCKFS